MGKTLAAIACAIGVIGGASAARADGDCTQLPSGRSVRVPKGDQVEASRVLADADVISVDLSMLGEDNSAAVLVSAVNPFSCDQASPITGTAHEGPRSAGFGTDYVRFWYDGNQVIACLPVTGGSVSVTIKVSGDVQPGDADVVAMTQAIADAFVRGDCTAAATIAPATTAAAAATSDTASAGTTYTPASVGDDLAMKDPFMHFRVTVGADDGLEVGDGIGSTETAALEYLGPAKNGVSLGLDAHGGRAAGHWAAGATALFGPIGSSGRNTFGVLAGASYDAIFDDVLSVFAIHGRLLYGRRLDARSSLELSLDGAWATDGPPAYAFAAPTVPFVDAAELDVLYARGYYAIGVDYRELLGGRFVGVAVGFGIGTTPGTPPPE